MFGICFYPFWFQNHKTLHHLDKLLESEFRLECIKGASIIKTSNQWKRWSAAVMAKGPTGQLNPSIRQGWQMALSSRVNSARQFSCWTLGYKEDSEPRQEGRETNEHGCADSNTRVWEQQTKLEKAPNLTGIQVTRNTILCTEEGEKQTPVPYTTTAASVQSVVHPILIVWSLLLINLNNAIANRKDKFNCVVYQACQG